MPIFHTECKNCHAKLVVDKGDCYAGGLRDNEPIFCPECGESLGTVYTSGTPRVYFASKSNK